MEQYARALAAMFAEIPLLNGFCREALREARAEADLADADQDRLVQAIRADLDCLAHNYELVIDALNTLKHVLDRVSSPYAEMVCHK